MRSVDVKHKSQIQILQLQKMVAIEEELDQNTLKILPKSSEIWHYFYLRSIQKDQVGD